MYGQKVAPYPYVYTLPVQYPQPEVFSPYGDDDDYDDRRDTAGWMPGVNCQCLSILLGGLALAALLIAAITIPVLITILKPATDETLSTTSTSDTTVLLNITTETSTTTTSETTTTTTSRTTLTTSTTTTTDTPCLPTCNSQQTCVHGVCVGVGYLSTTLTWSRPGDGDIVVATPYGSIIYFGEKGPSYLTDYGELDVDNRNATGPENVFWSSSGSLPPTGTYYVCFSQYTFNPNATTTYPVTATVTIMKSANITATFTRTFTSRRANYITCDASSNTLLGSFTYP